MKSSAALVAALVLAPVVLLAQKTSFDYDKTANFAAFKTFALKDGTKVGDPLDRQPDRRRHRSRAGREGADRERREAGRDGHLPHRLRQEAGHHRVQHWRVRAVRVPVGWGIGARPMCA